MNTSAQTSSKQFREFPQGIYEKLGDIFFCLASPTVRGIRVALVGHAKFSRRQLLGWSASEDPRLSGSGKSSGQRVAA
ncbi:MAG: hypothetical protein ACKVH7_09975, partial [Alphaproteobacteria bacterium]